MKLFYFFLGWVFYCYGKYPEIPAANLKSCCQLIENVGGIGIRNIQNIFRKIYGNNSENKWKLSYTPKPFPTPNHASQLTFSSRTSISPEKLIQT
jgi:hypothetical protein